MNEAESTLLSYLIFNPNFYRLKAGDIVDGIFTSNENKSVFNAFKSVLDSGGNVNTITVSKQMKIENAFEVVSRILQKHVYSDIDDIVSHLVNEHKDRQVGVILAEAMGRVSNSGWQDACQYLTSQIVELNQNTTHIGRAIKEDINDLFSHIERNLKSTGLTGIGTGLKDFDEFSGGLQCSDLVILAGRTSMGKTSLALTIARNAAVKFKTPTVIFTLEMSSIQLTARTASMESGISSKEILNTKLQAYQITEIKNAVDSVYDSKLFIAKTSNKISSILSAMMGYILKEGAKLFVVDYLQLVSLGQKVNREQEVGTMARIFKNFAMENNVCIILLSQLSRGSGGKNEPTLSDLRDSGQIEEAADVVMFAHRPEYYGDTEFSNGDSAIGKAELIIAKGRNIGIARIRLNFIASQTKFTDETSISNNQFQPSDEF
jgi:replicative DNA helicase